MSGENGTPSDLDNALEVVRMFPEKAAETIIHLREVAVNWKGSAEIAWEQNERLLEMIDGLLTQKRRMLNELKLKFTKPWHRPRRTFGRKEKRFWTGRY